MVLATDLQSIGDVAQRGVMGREPFRQGSEVPPQRLVSPPRDRDQLRTLTTDRATSWFELLEDHMHIRAIEGVGVHSRSRRQLAVGRQPRRGRSEDERRIMR